MTTSQNLTELLPVLSKSIITPKQNQPPLKQKFIYSWKLYHFMQALGIKMMSQSRTLLKYIRPNWTVLFSHLRLSNCLNETAYKLAISSLMDFYAGKNEGCYVTHLKAINSILLFEVTIFLNTSDLFLQSFFLLYDSE